VTRREALIAAAAWAMAEYGPAECSARTVAAAADLPLAAVSYYFPKLDELHGLAAQRLVADWLNRARAAVDATRGHGAAGAIEMLTHALLPSADPTAVRTRYELVLGAAKSAALAGPVADLREGLLRIIGNALIRADLRDAPAPSTVRAAVDGAMLDALGRGEPDLTGVVRAMLTELLL
jgi:DNA-binding transcriptional regulator YbjK